MILKFYLIFFLLYLNEIYTTFRTLKELSFNQLKLPPNEYLGVHDLCVGICTLMLPISHGSERF